MGGKSKEISEPELLLMKKSLGIVTDKRRRGWHFLRNLVDILFRGLSAALCGWTEFERMEALGLEREEFFKGFFEVLHGIPDACTFNRAFSSVQSAQLLEALKRWYAENGKTIQGSTLKGKKAVHVVSLWFGVERMVIGQKACDEKSNKITAIPELPGQLDVEGTRYPRQQSWR
jgi:hypothetical protein